MKFEEIFVIVYTQVEAMLFNMISMEFWTDAVDALYWFVVCYLKGNKFDMSGSHSALRSSRAELLAL